SRRRHTRSYGDWSSDVCSSDLRLRLRDAGRARVGGAPPAETELVRFEEHVRRALDALPPELAKGLENVAVVIEEEDPEDPDLFGLWESAPYMPDKITIFRRPLEASFSGAELEAEIRITA